MFAHPAPYFYVMQTQENKGNSRKNSTAVSKSGSLNGYKDQLIYLQKKTMYQQAKCIESLLIALKQQDVDVLFVLETPDILGRHLTNFN